ncbi:type I secretion system permease/ATPase [Phenylobacterium sp. LjRoot225]|uniref:type I secretion system permease/ATPase n=1 Tax=Phenylobacterium sp. LjRoot225 TaxID=3342285 RepID=UPI003ECCD020
MFLKSFVGASAILKRAHEYCGKHILFAAVFSAFINVLYLAPTLYMLVVYDKALPTQGHGTLLLVSAILLLALAVLSLLDWMRTRLLVRISGRLERHMSAQVLEIAMGDPRITHRRRLQAIRDFDVFRQAISGGALLAILDAPWAPIFLLAAFALHPMLGGVTLVAMIAFVLLAIANERATGPEIAAASEAATRTYATQDHAVGHADTLRALGMVRPMVNRHVQERSGMINLQIYASFVGGAYVTWTKFLRMALQSGALGLGAWLAINHEISAGSILAASLLMTRALAPVEQIVGGWKSIVQARTAGANLEALFDSAGMVAGETELPPAKGALRFEEVSAKPAESDRLAITKISFEMLPGEVVAVVGPSGAGKSTLVRVAAGAAQPASGIVRLDGADLQIWPANALAAHVGYLPQDFVLFPGSVKDNISRFAAFAGGTPREIDRAVVAAAKLIGAHEMILQLPRGYDTEIGFNGLGLSGGQRQRVALARAVYGSPSLLVLDEPNANLDTEGELALSAAVMELRQRGVSVLMVVHHGAILRCANRVMILRDGELQAMGPADQLLRFANPPGESGAIAAPPAQVPMHNQGRV